ncbi:hypothetical protein ZWY2020_020623 [Hordeum vulgare]|nr:hypothetical protein ZWY2020_020623 [Hordeum vulgare]
MATTAGEAPRALSQKEQDIQASTSSTWANTWEKLQLAARVIVAIENPHDIIVQSARPYGQAVALKFARHRRQRYRRQAHPWIEDHASKVSNSEGSITMGIYIINLGKYMGEAPLGEVIAAIENPHDIIARPPLRPCAVLKFRRHRRNAIAGRHTPGTFTNQMQTSFSEPIWLLGKL